MARELPYIAAIGEAVQQEMERDDTVLYFGQNLATNEEDPFLQAFGSDRVRVTPISETAEIGMAVGAAFAGYRPVVQLYMAEFMLVAMDQVVNEAPRFHYMTGGQVTVPIVLQAGYGFTAGWAGQHTGSIYGMFMGVPGLKVAVPATAADAKGLMTASIRDEPFTSEAAVATVGSERMKARAISGGARMRGSPWIPITHHPAVRI
jgi:pyruvate dehydrogenase E1 component beta subunit